MGICAKPAQTNILLSDANGVVTRLVHGEHDKKSLITIAVPTYNRPHLLKEALKSAIKQNGDHHYEIVVVDNSGYCDDRALNIIKEFNKNNIILYRNDKNVGMFENWNRILNLVKTDWLTILNDDDLLHPEYLNFMVQYLHNDKYKMVACQVEALDERLITNTVYLKIIKYYKEKWLHRKNDIILTGKDYFLQNWHYGSLGIIFRKKDAISHGGFKASIYPAADYELISSMAIDSNVLLSHRVLAKYRIHSNESLKIEVQQKFIAQNEAVRKLIAKKLSGAEFVKQLYIYILRERDKLLIPVMWNNNSNYSLRVKVKTLFVLAIWLMGYIVAKISLKNN